MATPAEEIDVDGVKVRLTNREKVYFPKLGKDGTKGALFDYYLSVADHMVHLLRDRPVHLQRFPDGIEGEEIYQKRDRPRNLPPVAGRWLTRPRCSTNGRKPVANGRRGRHVSRPQLVAQHCIHRFVYSTGFRVQEAGYLLLAELPSADVIEAKLPAAIAKYSKARMWYAAPTVMRTLRSYVTVARTAAVRRAIREGRYDEIEDIIWVTEVRRSRKGTLEAVRDDGAVMSLNTMKPTVRRRLFWLRDGPSEPMMLWLNEGGTPFLGLTPFGGHRVRRLVPSE